MSEIVHWLRGTAAVAGRELLSLFVTPLAYLVGPVLGHGLLAIWSLQILQRGMASAVFAVMWQRRGWTQIRL